MVLHLLLIRGAARFAFIGASALESSSDEVGNDPVAEVGQKGRIGGGAVESGQAVSRRFSVCQIEVVCNHLLAQCGNRDAKKKVSFRTKHCSPGTN